jgi:OmpA-OmpF porin, OOP family
MSEPVRPSTLPNPLAPQGIARRSLCVALTLIAGLLIAPLTARAQGGPVDLNMFKPAMDSKGHFSVDSTQVLGPWNTSFGLMVNYAKNPLDMKGANGRFFKTTDMVGANLQFAMGLFKLTPKGKPWLEVGFGIPIAFHNSQIGVSAFNRDSGAAPCAGSTYGCTVWRQDQGNKYPMLYDEEGRFTSQGLGDMYLHFKFRFKDTSTFPVGLGAMLSIYFPSSRVGNGHEKMIGSGGITIAPKFLLDKYWRKQKILLSVNFGLRLRFATTGKLTGNEGWSSCQWTDSSATGPQGQACGQDTDNPFPSDYGFNPDQGDNGLARELTWLYEVTYGVGMSWTLVPSVVFVAELFGSIELGSLMADDRVYQAGDFTDPTRTPFMENNLTVSAFKRSFPLELMSGFKFYLAASSFFAISAGVGLTGVGPLNNVGAPDFRVFASFVFEPTVGDRDGDGIKDDVDKCPDKPEDFDDFQDRNGCPDPDNDQDGILDIDDRCPNTPENYNGLEDNDGCPEKSEEDRDGDGIADSVDKCPDVPEDKDGFEDKDGCPDLDNDGDGVADRDDQCRGKDGDKTSKFVKTKEDKDGFEDSDGCPDPDNDQDTILDKDDACPNEKETFNKYKDDDGCPDTIPFKIGKTGFQLNEKIYFQTNKDIIRKVSFKLLNTLAEVIIDRKDLMLTEIQGHTDQRGSRNYNLQLSQKRAESVMRYLVNKGVAAKRLKATGYGKGRLKCKAKTVLCWSTNRRVEFVIIKRGKAPK